MGNRTPVSCALQAQPSPSGSRRIGQDDWIRTSDLHDPNVADFQAFPHPVVVN